MAIKKVRERFHNGGTTGTEADYDVLHYETSEDMIIGQVQNLATTGYRTLPGGLIMQWGIVEGVTNSWKTVRFPIEFPKASISVQLQELNNTGGATQTYLQDAYVGNKTLFTCKHEGTTSRKFYWFAIGY